ncbi:MAG: DUF1365 domain-containing protein [Planctomyces sp.]
MTIQHSCLYEGTVHHRRTEHRHNEFHYRVSMAFLDLSELDEVFHAGRIWSDRWYSPVKFLRKNYLGPADRPLDHCVRDLVEDRTGRRPKGAIRMLTNLTHFGFSMNPVSFYYCYGDNSASAENTSPELSHPSRTAEQQPPEFIIAEVTNTPWNERYYYVMEPRTDSEPQPVSEPAPVLSSSVISTSAESRTEGASNLLKFENSKEFHVSPFMKMDRIYRWLIRPPGSQLYVQIESRKAGNLSNADAFSATLSLHRVPLTLLSQLWSLCLFPFMTWKVFCAIYWQALKLWWKKVPFVPHPGSSSKESSVSCAGTSSDGSVIPSESGTSSELRTAK